MKVKIFKGINFKELEDRVNTFIEDKCVINISHEITFCGVCRSLICVLIIIVLYDEFDHCGYLDIKSLNNFKEYKL